MKSQISIEIAKCCKIREKLLRVVIKSTHWIVSTIDIVQWGAAFVYVPLHSVISFHTNSPQSIWQWDVIGRNCSHAPEPQRTRSAITVRYDREYISPIVSTLPTLSPVLIIKRRWSNTEGHMVGEGHEALEISSGHTTARSRYVVWPFIESQCSFSFLAHTNYFNILPIWTVKWGSQAIIVHCTSSLVRTCNTISSILM